MFLFIGESLGMQELIFIGIIALIVFGPRKLPQMARTIGKAMAEFRKATNEFKETWEKEVDFDGFKEPNQTKTISPINNSIAKTEDVKPNQFSLPEIKEINQEDFDKNLIAEKTENQEKQPEKMTTGKQDWL